MYSLVQVCMSSCIAVRSSVPLCPAVGGIPPSVCVPVGARVSGPPSETERPVTCSGSWPNSHGLYPNDAGYWPTSQGCYPSCCNAYPYLVAGVLTYPRCDRTCTPAWTYSRTECAAENATVTPSVAASPSSSVPATASSSVSLTPSPTPSATGSGTASGTVSAVPSVSASTSASRSPTASLSSSASTTSSQSFVASPSSSPTASPTITALPSASSSTSSAPSASLSPTVPVSHSSTTSASASTSGAASVSSSSAASASPSRSTSRPMYGGQSSATPSSSTTRSQSIQPSRSASTSRIPGNPFSAAGSGPAVPSATPTSSPGTLYVNAYLSLTGISLDSLLFVSTGVAFRRGIAKLSGVVSILGQTTYRETLVMGVTGVQALADVAITELRDPSSQRRVQRHDSSALLAVNQWMDAPAGTSTPSTLRVRRQLHTTPEPRTVTVWAAIVARQLVNVSASSGMLAAPATPVDASIAILEALKPLGGSNGAQVLKDNFADFLKEVTGSADVPIEQLAAQGIALHIQEARVSTTSGGSVDASGTGDGISQSVAAGIGFAAAAAVVVIVLVIVYRLRSRRWARIAAYAEGERRAAEAGKPRKRWSNVTMSLMHRGNSPHAFQTVASRQQSTTSNGAASQPDSARIVNVPAFRGSFVGRTHPHQPNVDSDKPRTARERGNSASTAATAPREIDATSSQVYSVNTRIGATQHRTMSVPVVLTNASPTARRVYTSSNESVGFVRPIPVHRSPAAPMRSL